VKLGRIGTIAAAAVLAAAPASAIDLLTGTYTGKMSCKGQSGIEATKSKSDITIDVVEGMGVLLQVKQGPILLAEVVEALVLESMAKPDRAKLGGLSCLLEAGQLSGIAFQADAVIKEGSEKGTLKGSLIRYESGASIVDVCTFSAKRTSTAAPVLAACPSA
jgi:hypothetical protein